MAVSISVVMPVYNSATYLATAIESMLNQSWRDFELIIVDDGSTDASADIAARFQAQDARIRLLRFPNQGQSAALNTGIAAATGTYIAIMHADDISLPERLAAQKAYLDAHPAIGLCGTWVKTIGMQERRIEHPTDPDDVQATLLFYNPLIHPTFMLRRQLIVEHALRYEVDAAFTVTQDYLFLVECAAYTRLANVPQVLVHYRIHPEQASNNAKLNDTQAMRIQQRQLHHLGISPTPAELEVHYQLGTDQYTPDAAFVAVAGKWLNTLWQANQRQPVYPASAFEGVLKKLWLRLYSRAVRHGWYGVRFFLWSPLRRWLTWREQAQFLRYALATRLKPTR